MKVLYGVLALLLLTSTCYEGKHNTLKVPIDIGSDVRFSTDSEGIMFLEGFSVNVDSLLTYLSGNLWKENSMIIVEHDGRIPNTHDIYLGYKGNNFFWVKDEDEVRFYYDCSSITEGTYYNEKYLYKDVKVSISKNGLVKDQDGTTLYRILFVSENTLQIIDRNRHLMTFEKRPVSEIASHNNKYKTCYSDATQMFRGSFESGVSDMFSFDENEIPVINGHYMSYEYFMKFFGFCWRHHADYIIQNDGSLGNQQKMKSAKYLIFSDNKYASVGTIQERYEILSLFEYRHNYDCTLYLDTGDFIGRVLNCDINQLSMVVPDEKSESGYKLTIYQRVYEDSINARLKALVETYQSLSKPISQDNIVEFSLIEDGTPILSGNHVDRQKYFEIIVAGGRILKRSSIVCIIDSDGRPDYKVDRLKMKQKSFQINSYREDGIIKDNSGKMIMQIIYLHPDYIQVIENLNADSSQSPIWAVTTYE